MIKHTNCKLNAAKLFLNAFLLTVSLNIMTSTYKLLPLALCFRHFKLQVYCMSHICSSSEQKINYLAEQNII